MLTFLGLLEGETIPSSIEFYLGRRCKSSCHHQIRDRSCFCWNCRKDEFGEKLIRMISSENIDTSLMNSKVGQSGTALINVLENSNNEVISYPGTNKLTQHTFIDEGSLSQAEIIFVKWK